ncbi:acyl-CoA dehydrogenase family protein [Chelatococcus reniformis]|uniref:Acyl-CoA dehydrogenase/oxidase N-terminal domain-containing protein n=1 Tax=Chelatococcus reniformis TaxID=1494448 RepID=A0A916UBU9_9HYPH|nr:acyl-CoA dehydrogenase family protein [Chelatococcus reniformis]GGC66635.1 hypothetical protein GCM10010994_26520 [Chelatococcus reniformis]
MLRAATASPSQVTDLRRLIDEARGFALRSRERAVALDTDDAFPAEDMAELAGLGLLQAPLPAACGGVGLATTAAAGREGAVVLALIGWGNLAVGRLFEGHVNAIQLVATYGTPGQLGRFADEAARGRLFGVWNTQSPESGVRLLARGNRIVLDGAKTFASGAGYVARPLITAATSAGEILMVMPQLDGNPARADVGTWRAHGMRASATGRYDFTGLAVEGGDIIGAKGDYHREPAFSGGAWRFLAVQLGGMDRLLDELRHHLCAAGRGDDAYQLARTGQAAVAVETARLWVERAADMALRPGAAGNADEVVAYTGLARTAVERAGLDVMEGVARSIGLSGFLRTHPVERVARDLATYLRQPAPDRALAVAAAHVLANSAPSCDLWRTLV